MYHSTTEPMWAPHKVRRVKLKGHREKEKVRNLRKFRSAGLAFRAEDRHN